MSTGHLPNQSLGKTRALAFSLPSNIKLSPLSATDSSEYFSQGQPSIPSVVPSEYQDQFSSRIPSPHPELSPPHDARSRSWSQSSSSNLTASSIVPSRELGPQTRGSSQYFTPAGSLRSWSSLQPPLLQSNSNQISDGGSALRPQGSPARGSAETGYFGTAASVLSSLFTPVAEAQASGYSSVQRRYTEDWVLQRGYQQHRRSSSSWYTEPSDDSGSDKDIFFGAHRRNPSNAKTITPADFQAEEFLVVPEAELSSDTETGISEGGVWKTAPQSLIGIQAGQSSPMAMLASRWASTPTIMEDSFGKSSGVSDIRVEQEHPNSDLSVFGVVENGLDTKMIRTPSSSTGTTATHTPQLNGLSASLLTQTPTQISRSNTPKQTKRWKGKNVVINIPSSKLWGLPLQEGGRLMPLTSSEMEERSKKWEAQGYTVQFLNGQGGQSRDVFPEDIREKVKEVVVSIPDRKEWEEYCNQLREEKLRALGVILGEEAPAPTPAATRGQTPLSHHQSPAPYQANLFSSPQPTHSAMSNGMGGLNGNQNGNTYHGHHYSPSLAQAPIQGPVAHMPSPVPAPANHHLAFHMPRQSMSMSTTPINPHDWDPYNNIYTPPPPPPPQNQPIPPMMNGSGVWSPNPFAMRNGSPMGGMGHHSHHSHSPSMFTPQYLMEENQDYILHNEYVENQRAAYYGHNHHHSLVGMDRLHQQQMRRGSPLAQVGHPIEEVEDQAGIDMMAIDAPVPKHRHHLSISLQKDMEGMENYQKEIETHIGNAHHLANGDGFNTNPVSPAPEVMYPQHPDIPNVENDVHNGPELLSNPEEDVSDVETERRQNQQAARERTQNIGMNGQQYGNTSLSMPESQLPVNQYIPQQQYQQHSRDTSLSQMQHQYDTADPREHSALSMLMAGSGIGTGPPRLGGRVGLDELLSEDGRTNISDIMTNPSEPPSPRPKYATSHMHNMSNISNNSNAWMSDTSKPPGSTTSSTKFNARAKEFEFNPSSTFTYSPKIKPFVPSGSVGSSPIGSTTHSRNGSQEPIGFGAFGGKGKFNVAAAPFRPRLFSSGSASSAFAKKVAAFSPDAPEFKPKSAASTPPKASGNTSSLPPIFSPTDETSLAASDKKTSPISLSPSRLNFHKDTPADEVDDDAREGSVSGGGGKRAKHGPTLSLVNDTEVPALESLQPSGDVEISGVNAVESHLLHDTVIENTVVESNASSDEVEDVPKELPVGEEPFVIIEEGLAMADTNVPAVPSRGDTHLDVLDKELAIEEPQVITTDTPMDALMDSRLEKSSTPLPVEEPEQSTLQPVAQDFNFDFSQPAEHTSPIKTKLNGMGESRYSHSPSPPPSHPAPPLPAMGMASFTPPENLQPYNGGAFEEPTSRPMPTDSELDEIFRHMADADQDNDEHSVLEHSVLEVSEKAGEQADVEEDEEDEEDEENEEEIVTWKRDTPRRPAIPLFREPTPTSELQNPFEQAERSAGPSPSPQRAFYQRCSSFSPDGEEYAQAQTTSELGYQPPTQEDVGHAQVDSDWDDMIEGEEDTKLRPQSRLFFDAHVEELVSGLLRSRLDPVHKSLSAIHDVLKSYSLTLGRRGSVATSAVHSDADDEDDTQPPRSPKKDKKSEKIKSAVVEALVMHNWSAPTEDKLAEIYGAIAKVSRAFQDSHLNDDLAETKTAILDALVKTAHSDEINLVKQDILTAIKRMAKATDIEELQASFASSVSKIAQVEDIASIRENMEDIFKDVVQTGDIVNMKLELRDALINTAQKIDIEEVKRGIAEILSNVTHKQDLEDFQNITIDILSKVAKTNDITELKNISSEVLKTVHNTDVKGEVQKLSHENAAFRQTLTQVLEFTQENAKNVDSHQESQEGFIRQNHTAVKESLETIHTSVTEVHKLVQQRVMKEDVHRSLHEGEQKQNFADIKTVIEEVNKNVVEVVARVPNVEDIRLVVGKISESQPRIGDIKNVFEEVAKGQPTLEEVRSVIEEVSNKQPTIEELRFVVEEVASNQPRLSDVKAVMEEVTEGLPKIDALRSMMEELLSKHQTVAVARASEQVNAEELQLRMAALEKLLGEADRRAEAESQARRESHERSLELESRLRIAEEEAARYRDKAEESDRRLKAIDDKRHQALTQTQMRSALLEGAHSSLRESVGDLSARNASLEGTLREVQQASERHMEEANRVGDENRELRRVIESLKAEMEESIRVREGFRGKFDKLQGDMQTAAYEIGQEQAKWRKIQEEQKARIEVLDAKVAAEVTVKERLESEVMRLEVEQKEAIRLKLELEQMKRSNAKLEELLDKFREEAMEHSQRAAVLTHEVESARESAHDEVARVRESLQRDVDAANTEVNAVRASLEREIEQARYEVDRVVQEASAEKEQFKFQLDEAANAKRAALDELERTKAALSNGSTESKSIVLQELQHKYERQLSELRQQVEDTRSQHDRALRIATEDGEREQYFLSERLNISQSESKHLREYIVHLKEQVNVATTAAQAAAQAAQSATSLMAPQPNHNEERALRESVNVLQEQLQQREARIDELEQQLSKFDKADIKRKDEQITWLRELLEVRIDELEEIVHSLSLPHFDRESVRDTALRLRANLQMEQREKEMSMGVGREVTPIASLASRLPGVANTAASWWNSKNKGPSSVAQSSTPSRPTSAAGFLNGILPPPATLASAQRIGSRLARGMSSETASNTSQNTITSRQRDKQVAIPSYRADRGGSRRVPQPQLFRRGSYDQDADANDSILSGEFYEDEDNATETGADDGDLVPYRPSSYRN